MNKGKYIYVYVGKYANDDIVKIGETIVSPAQRQLMINKYNTQYKGEYKHLAYVRIRNNGDTTMSRYIETTVQHKLNRFKDYEHLDGRNKDHFISYCSKEQIIKDFISIVEPILKEENLEYHIVIKG